MGVIKGLWDTMKKIECRECGITAIVNHANIEYCSDCRKTRERKAQMRYNAEKKRKGIKPPKKKAKRQDDSWLNPQ